MTAEVRCLGASGQLGYGIPPAAFDQGIATAPDVIAADMGSIDPGMAALGSGVPVAPQLGRRSDLEMLLTAGVGRRIPVIIGSAGTAGGDANVDDTVALVREIAAERGLRFRLATVRAELSVEIVERALDAGRVRAFRPDMPLTAARLRQTAHVVAQMGVEPLVAALRAGADVVVAGRASDAAVFAAYPVAQGFDMGLAMHMGKLLECASQCAVPAGRDAIMGYIGHDAFVVESMNPTRACVPFSVAAQSVYEQPRSDWVEEPGGAIDLREAVYEAVDARRTRVRGSRWRPTNPYTVKLEGAALAGYRSFALGGVRDPILIPQLGKVTRAVARVVEDALARVVDPRSYELRFHVYGQDAVLGPLETVRTASHEVLVLIDAVGQSAEIAHAVCGAAKQYLLHAPYEGIRGTGGNLAIPFSPEIQDAGPVYELSVYHLMEVDDPVALFPVELSEVGGGPPGALP